MEGARKIVPKILRAAGGFGLSEICGFKNLDSVEQTRFLLCGQKQKATDVRPKLSETKKQAITANPDPNLPKKSNRVETESETGGRGKKTAKISKE